VSERLERWADRGYALKEWISYQQLLLSGWILVDSHAIACFLPKKLQVHKINKNTVTYDACATMQCTMQ
jgi:hypothetical protein